MSHGTLRAARSSVSGSARRPPAASDPGSMPSPRSRVVSGLVRGSVSPNVLHDRELAGRDLRRQRFAQRGPAHLGRHPLVVAARRGPERLAAALPLGGADRALPRPPGALLLPRLPAAAARDVAAALGSCVPVRRAASSAPPPGAAAARARVRRTRRRTARGSGPSLPPRHGNASAWLLALFAPSAAAPWFASRSCGPARGHPWRRESRRGAGSGSARGSLGRPAGSGRCGDRRPCGPADDGPATRATDPTRRRSNPARGGTSIRGSRRRPTSRGA